MDPHSQVSNKETFCPGQGKSRSHFSSAGLKPHPGQPVQVHMYSPVWPSGEGFP